MDLPQELYGKANMTSLWVSFGAALLATAGLLASLAWATAQYIFAPPQPRHQAGGYSFILPEGWSCAQEGTETVCKPEPGALEKRAIIVATSKVAGPNDNYEYYRSYLSRSRSIEGRAGDPPLQTERRYLRETMIGQTLWLESLQLNGELPNYFTYYWAAKESALSVLVTYSVHKDLHESIAPTVAAFGDGLEARRLN